MHLMRTLARCVLAVILAGAPVLAGQAACANPFLYEVFVAGKTGTDPDANGFMDTFAFDVRIDANTGDASSTPVAAIIWCTATSQAFVLEPWTITGNLADAVVKHFTERDFHVPEPLALRFRVELWRADYTAMLDVREGLFGEPVLADGPPCSAAWLYAAGVSEVAAQDPDSDGCAESFSFSVTIDADTAAGCTKQVASEIVCLSTGQSWRTNPWTISGDARDAFSLAFAEDDFALATCTDLRFRVRLFDPSFITQYGEAFIEHTVKADRPPCTNVLIGEAVIARIYNAQDADADGYLNNYDVDIRVDANAPGCSMPVTATVTCVTTGAELTSAPFIVNGADSADAVVLSFNYGELGVPEPTTLAFKARLWNAAHSVPLTAAVDVAGGPLKAEAGTLATGLTVRGTIRYQDRNGVLHPVRYAEVELCEQTASGVVVRCTRRTDGNGLYSAFTDRFRPINVFVRVNAEMAYPGSPSHPAIVMPPGSPSPYAVVSPTRTGYIGSQLNQNIEIGKGDPAAAAFHVLDSIVDAYEMTLQWLVAPGFTGFPGLLVTWPDATPYSFIEGLTMHAVQQDRWDHDVLMAVYGRYAGQQLGFDAGVAGDHLWSSDLRVQPRPLPAQDAARLAFAEGLAACLAVAFRLPVTNDAAFDDSENIVLSSSLESGSSAALPAGEYRISSIACSFWDLIDDNNDAADDADDISVPVASIATVLTTDKPQTMESFWAAWTARYDCKVQTYRVFRRHQMSFLPAPCTVRIAATQRSHAPAAEFILLEQDSQPISGTAPAVFTGMPPGRYTLTWSGPDPPLNGEQHSQVVEAGGSITFFGYFEAPADAAPPVPNAFTAELAGHDSCSITATPAADDSPPVQYRVIGEFYDGTQWTPLAGAAGVYDWSEIAPAGWISGGLAQNGLYRYKQWVRDSAPEPNADGPSTCEPIAIPLQAPADPDISVTALSPISAVVTVTPPPKPSGTGQTAAFFQIANGAGQGLGAVSPPWSDAYAITFSNLLPDTTYGWRVRYRGYAGDVTGYNPTEAIIRMPADTPGQCTVTRVSACGLQLRLSTASNPATTLFAIMCTAGDPPDDRFVQHWLDGCGKPSLLPHWLTADVWLHVAATGLRPETTYSFAAAARNAEGLETALGPDLAIQTSVQGDANSDCRVNILDLLAIRSVLNADICSNETAAHADLNADGRVNILDLIACRINLNRQCQ